MEQYSAGAPNDVDYINSTSVFSGFKRIVQSKNFKGGSITVLFGSVELEMTHADLNTAVIDITQAFGEVKLYVPVGWRIQKEITHFLSVINDHRVDAHRDYDNTKLMVLKGFSTFGAVEILTGGDIIA